MTNVEISLPDALAEEAKRAGLLAPEQVERLFRERLRADALAGLDKLLKAATENPLPPMSADELNAEISAAREIRRAGRF